MADIDTQQAHSSRGETMLRKCAAVVLLLLGACPADKVTPEIQPDAGPIRWGLSLTHDSQIVVDPGATFPLRAMYFNTEVGGLENQPVSFLIVGDAQGGSIETASANTDEDGFATMNFQAPLEATSRPIQIEVSAARVEAPLYVQITVTEPALRLLPVGATERDVRPNMILPVQILVERVGGGAMADVSVDAQIRRADGVVPPGMGLEEAGIGVVSTETRLSGIARVNLHTGPDDADIWVDMGVAGVGTVSYLLHVRAAGMGDDGCRLDRDCGEGFICVREGEGEEAQNVCVPDEESGCDPVNPLPGQCPPGFTCDPNGECVPGAITGCLQAPEVCPENFECVADVCVRLCDPDDLCPDGFDCVEGVCQEPDPPPDMVRVEGLWLTLYQFDLSDVLGFLGGLGAPLDFVDQAFRGNLNIPVPLLGDLIEEAVADLIARYVPPWVPDLVRGLNTLVHIFQELQVAGEMELRHRQNPLHVRGTEMWHHAIIHLIDRCPLGRQDPNYPRCAQVDIMFDQQLGDFGEIHTDPRPFTGRLYLDRQQNWRILLDREVEADLVGLVRYIVNLVVSISTEGRARDLPQALEQAIDCQGVARAANDAARQMGLNGGIPGVDQMCQTAVAEAGRQVDEILGRIGIGWEVMDFDQRAQVFDDNNDLLADELGRWPDGPGDLDGRFRLIWRAPIEGVWFGDRPR